MTETLGYSGRFLIDSTGGIHTLDTGKIEPLFENWPETMIWSCLQGCMGCATADRDDAPTAAMIEIAGFCFFAGRPDKELAARATATILVPQNSEWETAIQSAWGDRVQRALRYAIKKEPDAFDLQRLTDLAASLPASYSMRLFDRDLYGQAMEAEWSRDFCFQFADADDFIKRGLGVGVLCDGVLVAGAASYTVYRGGIEIEIDTKPEYRRRGLAVACGAKLILTCLERGLYPSWDAYDLRSVALAEKLGYRLDHPYTIFNVV